MQPPPITPTTSKSNVAPNHAIILATITAVCAILALPFAFLPFLGLAASTLVLGFITVLAIWTHRKRAFIGIGIAFLAMIISFISSFICISAILESRNAARARVAQVESQLQAMKAQTASASERNVLGDLIKVLDTNNDLTKDQANSLGKLGELVVGAFASDNTDSSDQDKK